MTKLVTLGFFFGCFLASNGENRGLYRWILLFKDHWLVARARSGSIVNEEEKMKGVKYKSDNQIFRFTDLEKYTVSL